MAIKGGDLIHTGNRLLIDRVQTAGPGDLTIDREKIYELGNYYSLGSILNTPDLSFSLESFDAAAEFEALLLGLKFTVANGTQVLKVTGNPTGGTFDVTVGADTATIPYNASPGAVQTLLEALPGVNPGDLTVSGSAGSTYTIAFSGNAGTTDYAVITTSATNLTGGTSPAVTVTATEGIGMPDGTVLNLSKYRPMDIISAFKPGFAATTNPGPYDVVGSVALPYLALESINYTFGVTDNANQSATLRGDSIYYSPSSTFTEEFAGTNAANQSVSVAHPAVIYNGDTTNGPRYALGVSLASGKRLLLGADYTESVTAGVLSVVIKAAVATTDLIRITYASSFPTSFPQVSHAPVTAVRPAAIRGRNVELYIGGSAITNRWNSVQSVNVQWQVTLDKDEELGNPNFVDQTFDVPAISGSVEIRPRDYQELYTKICQISGVTPGEVVGPLTTNPLEMLVVLHSPDTGQVLKTLEVPDARFTLPGYSGQAGENQKINITLNYESDQGVMLVHKGKKAGL